MVWLVFWVCWLIAATVTKPSARDGPHRFRPGGLILVALIALLRALGGGRGAIHAPALGGVGAARLVAGLAPAVWARIRLGRNWRMPMTRRAEPELITGGPYRFVRHPVYSGRGFGAPAPPARRRVPSRL